MVRTPATVRRVLKPRLQRRRFIAFGITAPRSGNHSLAGVLAHACRSAHRPTPELLSRWTVDLASGAMTHDDVRAALRRRDRELWLEAETSNLFEPFFDDLVAVFPDALFVLAIRDPFDWLRSYVDYQLHQGRSRAIAAVRDLRFGPRDAPRPEVEAALAQQGAYPVDRYLAWWADYHRKALATVPPERLFLLRTDELAAKLDELAAFLGLDSAKLDASSSHAGQARVKTGLVDALPPEYVEERIHANAEDLLTRFFPEHT